MPVNSAPDAPSVRWLPYYRVSTDRQGRSGLGLRGVLEPMARDGLSYRAMAAELAGVGKLSSTGRPLAQAQIVGYSSAWAYRESFWAVTRLGLLRDRATKKRGALRSQRASA